MIIYKTTNLVNGKIYIGQDMYDRPIEKYAGSGKILKKSIKKYGKENFIKEVLEIVPEGVEAFERENYWVEFYNSRDPKIGYNIAKPAKAFWTGCNHTNDSKQKIKKSNSGKKRTETSIKRMSDSQIGNKNRIGTKHSDESKIKMSDSQIGNKNRIGTKHTQESIDKIKEKRKHQIFSDETIEKIKQSSIGRKKSKETIQKIKDKNKGQKRSEKTKLKISQSLKGRKVKNSIPIEQYTLNGLFIREYESITLAYKETNINRTYITLCCKGIIEKYANYIWKYKIIK